MTALKFTALCFASACLSVSSAFADYEVQIQVRDVVTSDQYPVTVMTTPNETEAKEYREFLMFLFINDFDKFEDESGLEAWESVDDILTDITVVTVYEAWEMELLSWLRPVWDVPELTVNPNIGEYGPRAETGHSKTRTHNYSK